jgi:hypothetical protein
MESTGLVNIFLCCKSCRFPDLEIIEYIGNKPSTDLEKKYFKLYCPKCGNTTHTFTETSGLDFLKVTKLIQYEIME